MEEFIQFKKLYLNFILNNYSCFTHYYLNVRLTAVKTGDRDGIHHSQTFKKVEIKVKSKIKVNKSIIKWEDATRYTWETYMNIRLIKTLIAIFICHFIHYHFFTFSLLTIECMKRWNHLKFFICNFIFFITFLQIMELY